MPVAINNRNNASQAADKNLSDEHDLELFSRECLHPKQKLFEQVKGPASERQPQKTSTVNFPDPFV
jgi:hypothetical protein